MIADAAGVNSENFRQEISTEKAPISGLNEIKNGLFLLL
jgi:hypothetical protein